MTTPASPADSPAAAAPDVRQLRGETFATEPFPGGQRPEFRVFFAPEVHEQIRQHAGESLSLEICGVLVGDWRQDPAGPFLVISAGIRCDQAKSKFAEVTFTHEAWAKVNAQMDTKYSDRRIVGWYHSHPDFGIFLSDRDVFIHQHFFSGPGQVAFVVDPVRQTEGVFTWQQGRPALAAHYWIGDRVATARGAENPAPALAGDVPRAGEPAAPVPPSLWSSLWPAAGVVAVFLAGYLLANMRSAWERQTLMEGAAAHFGIFKGLRPELEDALAALDRELATVGKSVDRLSSGHAELAGEEKAKVREEWTGTRRKLNDARLLLSRIGQTYGLSPDERRTLAELLARRLAEVGSGRPPDEESQVDVSPLVKRSAEAASSPDRPGDRSTAPAKSHDDEAKPGRDDSRKSSPQGQKG